MYYYRLISSMLKAAISTLLTGLYAVYKAESNANDSLATYNGTAQGGLTYTTGKSGNAFTFNGTNSYVDLAVNSLKLTTMSLNFWIYLPSSQSTNVFANFGDDGQKKGFYLDINNSSSYSLRFVGFTSTAVYSVISAVGNNTYIGAYSMATMTMNGTSVKLYLNGSLAGSGTMASPLNYITTSYPILGAWRSGNGAPTDYLTNGTKIDEFYAWNRELTSTEITTLYNSGAGKFYPTY